MQETARLVRRPIDFDFDPAAVPPHWYGGDVYLTTFWNALSLLFPEGERFFVESVRRYRDRIDDPSLRQAIDAFIGQEAMHGRGHRAFNDILRARGLAVAERSEAQLRRLLDHGRRSLSHRSQLALTCALEHFTAILAEQYLARPTHRDAMFESVRSLWLWHALEESEHKAVAFDVYRAIGGSYLLRVWMMVATTALFFGETAYVYARLLKAEGRRSPLGWLRAIGYFWVSPGLFRKLIPAYLAYFRPSFHPHDRDATRLLQTWRDELFGDAGVLREQWSEASS